MGEGIGSGDPEQHRAHSPVSRPGMGNPFRCLSGNPFAGDRITAPSHTRTLTLDRRPSPEGDPAHGCRRRGASVAQWCRPHEAGSHPSKDGPECPASAAPGIDSRIHTSECGDNYVQTSYRLYALLDHKACRGLSPMFPFVSEYSLEHAHLKASLKTNM